MTPKKRRLSKQVTMLWDVWHNLKGPFTKWNKHIGYQSVRFEAKFKLVRSKMVRVEYIEEHKVVVIMPPLSEAPTDDYIIKLGNDTHTAHKKRIKDMVRPLIHKFIVRNY